MSNCRYCGSELVWIRMKSGKAMPCNTGKIPYKEDQNGNMKLVTEDGRVVTARPLENTEGADGIGYVSHYATCPGAERIRRK
jgi:hypothetical protein